MPVVEYSISTVAVVEVGGETFNRLDRTIETGQVDGGTTLFGEAVIEPPGVISVSSNGQIAAINHHSFREENVLNRPGGVRLTSEEPRATVDLYARVACPDGSFTSTPQHLHFSAVLRD